MDAEYLFSFFFFVRVRVNNSTLHTCGNANITCSHPRDLRPRAEERAWLQLATALNVFIKYKHVRTIILQTTAALCNETQSEREKRRRRQQTFQYLCSTCAQVGRDKGRNCSIFMCESWLEKCSWATLRSVRRVYLFSARAPIHGTI